MLTGTLDDFTLADVLRLVAGARRTGSLAVARDEGAGELHFRDGVVSRAVPRYERRTAPSSPNHAVEELTFDLMRWGRGGFEWTPTAPSSAGPEAAVDVDELLRRVTQRMDELAELRTLVPSEEAVMTMAPQPPEGAVQINITPAEWRVLVLVDGHRTVAEVAATIGLDDLEATKLLFGLASAGLVTAGDATPSPQPVSDMSDMTAVSAVSDPLREEPFAVETAPEEPEPEPVVEAPEPEPEPAPEPEPEPEPEPAPEPAAEAPAPEPEGDPFLSELDVEPLAQFDTVPVAPAGAHEAAAVDRSTVARELAGLFEDFEAPVGMQRMQAAPAGPPGPPSVPRRVEDDDQVTRGLISRLIDGVKGL